MKKTFTLLLMSIICTMTAMAQGPFTVKGTVTDEANGQPIVGVLVLDEATQKTATTDIYGQYQFADLTDNSTLIFSYFGMVSVTENVAGRRVLDVTMRDNVEMIDEVVVIGYGTASAKDLTSPIAVVDGEEITKHNTASAMSALQGKVAGVQIVSGGSPGESPTVRIRGIGSFSDSSPLYVVDGMFYDNIDFLNNSDIADISVLKDASAAAIYGVRAANGVVIVTTRGGKLNTPTKVTYDGYVGVQTVLDRLQMASSSQYSTMVQEIGDASMIAVLQNSINTFGGDLETLTPSTDTDWYGELLRNAMIQNHSIDISGGSSKVAYSMGVNYFLQDGILDSENTYERFNLRTKADYQAYSWLKLGASVVVGDITYTDSGSPWESAFRLPGIIPVYDETRSDEDAYPYAFASPEQVGLSTYYGNPVATTTYSHSSQESVKVLPVFYAEVDMFDGKLKFKSQYSQDLTFTDGTSWTDVYKVGGTQYNEISDLSKSSQSWKNYVFDNTLTYSDEFGKHGLNVMVGHSSRQENWRYLSGSGSNAPLDEMEYLYLSQTTEDERSVTDNGTTYNGLSFFGRVNYDFDGKYILSATMRADGSSKYQEKWGYFPSVGAAWIVTKSDFMQNVDVVDFLKVRASWGLLGNDKVSASDGFASINTGNSYSGVFGSSTLSGYTVSEYYSYLSWEVVNELNIGFDVSLLDNRLGIEFDWYNRLTQNAVFSSPLPMGQGYLLSNNGEIQNTGFEIGVNWNDRIGKDFNYYIGANVTTLKNQVTSLNGLEFMYGGSAEFRTIRKLGEEMDSYYGLQVEGVYQNDTEIANCQIAQDNDLEPGDFKYVDQNNDGVIDDDDRVILGSAIPDVMLGVTLGFEWKGFEFSTQLYAQFGSEIVNQKRGDRRWQTDINYDAAWVENRWTGEGSTNEYMSAAGSIDPWNISQFNSWYIESGDYFRIQNIQLAYNITTKTIGSEMPGIRVAFNAERPFTAFSANSFSPDIADGFDSNVYPQSSVFSFSLRLTL